jgi:hypothetical protein
MDRFIHIHIPKTAGSTRAWIFERLPYCNVHSENVYLAGVKKRVHDYEKYDIITGHFFADVYDHLPLVTFLRDPVERVISHYAHFQRSYKAYAADDAKGGLPWDYKYGYPPKSIDIIEFAEMWPNLMSSYVKGGNFSYVGVMEDFNVCLYELSILFNFEMPVGYINYRVTKEKPHVTEDQREIIALVNSEDVGLYNDVKNIRKRRNG